MCVPRLFPDVCLFNFLLKCLSIGGPQWQKQSNFKPYYSSLIFVGKIFGIHANYFIAEVEFFEGEDPEEPSDDNKEQEQQQDQVRKTCFQFFILKWPPPFECSAAQHHVKLFCLWRFFVLIVAIDKIQTPFISWMGICHGYMCREVILVKQWL